MLAMTLYPEAMRRAQDEIDTVVGRERMPNFKDRSKLPYVEAIIKEVHRWRPPTPLGVPREAAEVSGRIQCRHQNYKDVVF